MLLLTIRNIHVKNGEIFDESNVLANIIRTAQGKTIKWLLQNMDDSTVFQLADLKMCVTTPVCIDSCLCGIYAAFTQSECNKLKEKNRCTCKIIKLGFLLTNDGYFLSFFSGLGSMNVRMSVRL